MNQSNELTLLESKKEISFSEINQLTKLVGWGEHFYQTNEHWLETLEASTYVAYAKKDDQLICFGRILEDGQMCMFYDICVHPDYQKEHLGTTLMNHLINKIKDKNYVSVGLFVWNGNPTATEFYKKLGFECSVAMELKKHMKSV